MVLPSSPVCGIKSSGALAKSRRCVSGKVVSGHYESDIDRSLSWPGFAKISIEDTGGGILKERVDTLFTDYISTKRKGLGLGLAVTKKNVSD